MCIAALKIVKKQRLQPLMGLPLVVEASLSEQVAVEPPLLPTQVHDHGPLPLTAEAVPAVQRLVVGAVLTATPFAGPHCPFTVSAEATSYTAPAPAVPPAPTGG